MPGRAARHPNLQLPPPASGSDCLSTSWRSRRCSGQCRSCCSPSAVAGTTLVGRFTHVTARAAIGARALVIGARIIRDRSASRCPHSGGWSGSGRAAGVLAPTGQRHEVLPDVDVDVAHVRVGHRATRLMIGDEPIDDRALAAARLEVDGVAAGVTRDAPRSGDARAGAARRDHLHRSEPRLDLVEHGVNGWRQAFARRALVIGELGALRFRAPPIRSLCRFAVRAAVEAVVRAGVGGRWRKARAQRRSLRCEAA